MPKKYTTPSNQPKCVKYWDKKFRNYDFWFDWVATKAIAETKLPEIMQECECNKSEAREIVWGAFIEASQVDDTPMNEEFIDLVSGISDHEIPLFLCHLGIGSDIYFGFTEKQAIDIYKEWMTDDPNNPIFGEWKLTKSFKVIPHT